MAGARRKSDSVASILVLSWNLLHGRAVPSAWRPLAAEFAEALASWSWDVALLQEVPPWWPPRLGAAIGEHRMRELTRRPERRVMHGITLPGAGWVVNLHASTHPPQQRRADLFKAAATALEWADGAPLVFGGDLNSTRPAMPGLRHVAGHWVDHVFTDGRPAASEPEVLDAGSLSDHKPVRVEV